MRILITVLLLCISAVVFAQVNTSFRGTLNIYQASGTSPNYEIRGIFNDTQGQYTSDSVDVGDKIFILEAENCIELEITSLISTTGGIIRCNVIDVDTLLVNTPLGNAAILEPTGNFGFPTFIDGISNDLLSCIQTYFTHLVDNAITGSGDGDGIYGRNDTIPAGRISNADNFQILDENGSTNNYHFKFQPDNELVAMRADSVELELSNKGGIFYDYNTVKEGLQYATSGYVTQDRSLTDKEYVDNLVAGLGTGDALLKDTIYQAVHGFALPTHGFIPVYNNAGTWTLAQADDTLSLHTNYIVEILHTDTIVLQVLGRLDVPSHGLTVGSSYFLTDAGGVSTTGGTHNDYMCDVMDANTLMLVYTRPIYAGIPDTIAYLRDTTLFSGDVSGTYDNLQLGTGVVGSNEIASTAVAPGTYGTSTKIPSFTVDADGRITYATDTTLVTHDAVTVTDGSTIDLTLTGQDITAEVKPNSISEAELTFTPLVGSGTAGQVAVYSDTDSLTSYSTYTFNGTDNLTYYNVGLSQFTLGRFYLKYDSVNTAQQLLFGSTSRILSLPRSNSNGLIIYPADDNSTTSAALAFSTGRTNVQDANIIDVNTPQYIGSLAGSSFALNITNGISQNTGIDVSNGIGGGIDLTQTWAQPTDASTQKTEYYGIRLRPSINRNSGSNDNYYGLYIAPTLLNNAPGNWKGIYNTTTSAQGYFLIDVGGANNYFAGNTKIGYSTGTTNYRLHVTKSTGNYPMTLFGPANVKFQLKGGTTESITWSPNNYTNYPSLVALTSSPSSVLEISAIGSTTYDATAIFSGTTAPYTVSGNTWSMIGYGGLQATPDAAFTISSTGIQGIGEYLLQTAENADTHLGGSTITFQAIVGESRLSQAWSNGTLNFYAGRFLGNGVNSAGGTNATNNYGIYTYATGGTNSNWSIFSDDGNHYFEDSLKIGGSVATPGAMLHTVGASILASGNALIVENSAGDKIIRARNDLRVSLGNIVPVNAWVTVASSTTAGASINIPAGTAPTSPQTGDIWTSSTQQALTTNQAGVTQSINGTLFTGTSTVTVNNTAAETTLIPSGTGTLTLPANFWTVGKTLEITAYGDWRTDTVPGTLELRMELGGTLLCTTSAQTMVSTEGAQWKATATVTCRSTGVSGTTMSEGELRMNSDASTSLTYQMYRSTTNTIDTTTSAAFDITVTHGAADPFNEMRLHTLTIKALN
jgi:hypothetical protein